MNNQQERRLACHAIDGKFTFCFIMCLMAFMFLCLMIFSVNFPFYFGKEASKSSGFSRLFLKDCDLMNVGN